MGQTDRAYIYVGASLIWIVPRGTEHLCPGLELGMDFKADSCFVFHPRMIDQSGIDYQDPDQIGWLITSFLSRKPDFTSCPYF